ncbi:hypothetical protein [Saccharothrix coeruleofusca]|uniref:Short subunit dehydrogenase n=1 Tax=Saccharothrix coeruleofusca TaxID=33919 RepID=A0A918AUF6_9PSEU|nr:hypothetical protein [Saccharothrix coeruleofusca]GGP86519.1 hypothetical protein GCM10010185_70330 [Saccharothrix coeruleofusca]
MRAYNAAKLENVLFTRELHRRYHARGVSAVAFHPGNVATSFGTRSQSGLMRFITTSPLTRPLLTIPAKGAGQLVWPAESRPGVDWQSGEYYKKHKPAKRVNKQARDARLAREPWERLLG